MQDMSRKGDLEEQLTFSDRIILQALLRFGFTPTAREWVNWFDQNVFDLAAVERAKWLGFLISFPQVRVNLRKALADGKGTFRRRSIKKAAKKALKWLDNEEKERATRGGEKGSDKRRCIVS